jgi:hypothetical protein
MVAKKRSEAGFSSALIGSRPLETAKIGKMGKPKRFGDLELKYDPAHEEREWIAQRVTWAIMLLLCLAALCGLFGAGLLSHVQKGSIRSPLYVEYDRAVRYRGPSELRVFVRPKGDRFSLKFDRTYVASLQVEQITPEPIESFAAGSQYGYTFKSSGDEQMILFRFESGGFGKTSSKLTLDESESVEIKQFSWP